MAYASTRTDPDRHGGLRMGAARRQSDRGDPAGRWGLVPARREALARGHAHHGHDAHRQSGVAEREERRMDGKGQRHAIQPGRREMKLLAVALAVLALMVPGCTRMDQPAAASKTEARQAT